MQSLLQKVVFWRPSQGAHVATPVDDVVGASDLVRKSYGGAADLASPVCQNTDHECHTLHMYTLHMPGC